jgi:hypothetical protein
MPDASVSFAGNLTDHPKVRYTEGRDGTSLGVAVVPASVGPGGNLNLN